jgi:hypothetical protein
LRWIEHAQSASVKLHGTNLLRGLIAPARSSYQAVSDLLRRLSVGMY